MRSAWERHKTAESIRVHDCVWLCIWYRVWFTDVRDVKVAVQSSRPLLILTYELTALLRSSLGHTSDQPLLPPLTHPAGKSFRRLGSDPPSMQIPYLDRPNVNTTRRLSHNVKYRLVPAARLYLDRCSPRPSLLLNKNSDTQYNNSLTALLLRIR